MAQQYESIMGLAKTSPPLRAEEDRQALIEGMRDGTVDVKEEDVHKVNAAAQDGLPDNTYLRELNEATLLHNVRVRYNDEKNDGGCYSVTGHILIAVNPFRKLTIYEDSNVRAAPARCATDRQHAPATHLRPRPHCGAPFFSWGIYTNINN